MANTTIRHTIAIPCPSKGIAKHADNSDVNINLTWRGIPLTGRK
jgi:hypothetical protein